VKGPCDDARRAAEEWLTRNSLCEHDTGLLKFCPTCATSLAAVIDGVAESRVGNPHSSFSAHHAGETPAIESLRAECSRLISRMHGSLAVAMDCQDGEPEENTIAVLSEIRAALLKLAFDYFGDPEAEETLSREGHAT